MRRFDMPLWASIIMVCGAVVLACGFVALWAAAWLDWLASGGRDESFD